MFPPLTNPMDTPQKKKKTIYISGPMSGVDKHNFPAFDEAAVAFEKEGWHVLSPSDIARRFGVQEDCAPDKETLATIQKEDILALLQCSAVFMLRGWLKSEGARLEHSLAVWLGLDITYQELDSPPTYAEAPAPPATINNEEFVKVDSGVDPKGSAGDLKAPMWLLPPVALENAAWVHKLGADKYGPWNWRKTNVRASTYISAMLRHLVLGWSAGEDNDTESGRSHLAHIACCCNILMDAQHNGSLHDDRAKSV